jgi:hypothetical protein
MSIDASIFGSATAAGWVIVARTQNVCRALRLSRSSYHAAAARAWRAGESARKCWSLSGNILAMAIGAGPVCTADRFLVTFRSIGLRLILGVHSYEFVIFRSARPEGCACWEIHLVQVAPSRTDQEIAACFRDIERRQVGELSETCSLLMSS